MRKLREIVGPRARWVLLTVPVVLFAMVAVFLLAGLLVRPRGAVTAAERLKAESDARTTIVQALGGLALLSGLYFTARTLRLNAQTLEVNREGQITERFTRAIDQLGEPEEEKLAIRLGGIYALERIARDSKDDHGPIMEVLTAFVREQARWQVNAPESSRPAADVQAVVTVLGRRSGQRRGEKEAKLDLREVDLRGADLTGAHLEWADLTGAHLEGATLLRAHLEEANLLRAPLEAAHLLGAPLEGAVLLAAHLEGAALLGTHLEGANLLRTHLEGANLGGAHLEGANLIQAHLEGANLPQAHLEEAHLLGAYLSAANLLGAHLEGADLPDAHLEEANLIAANLSGANLSGADLTGAHLEGADLTGAHLEGADLSQTFGLTSVQIELAITNDDTVLPKFDDGPE